MPAAFHVEPERPACSGRSALRGRAMRVTRLDIGDLRRFEQVELAPAPA